MAEYSGQQWAKVEWLDAEEADPVGDVIDGQARKNANLWVPWADLMVSREWDMMRNALVGMAEAKCERLGMFKTRSVVYMAKIEDVPDDQDNGLWSNNQRLLLFDMVEQSTSVIVRLTLNSFCSNNNSLSCSQAWYSMQRAR